MALNVNIIGRDSEGNLRALKVNSEGNLEISDSLGWGELLQGISDKLELVEAELQTIKANQLSGDQKVQLSGTIVDDEVNALRVYQASVLSADQDSVALGGEIADQIVKRPKNFTRIYQSSAFVVPPLEDIVIIDEPRYVELTYLHLLSDVYKVGGGDVGLTLAVFLSPYYTSQDSALILPIQTDGRHGGAATYIGESYPDFWEAIVSRIGQTAESTASSRYVGSKVFPQGVRITLKNYYEAPLSASWMGGFYAY